MDASDYIAFAGLTVGILGFTYAVYANRTRQKLSDYVRAQNWHLYSKVNNASGSIQLAFARFKGMSPDSMDHETLEWLAKADAFGQDVLKDAVRQIRFSEPVFDSKSIQRWVREGRVVAEHAPLFETLAPANESLERNSSEGGD